MPPDQRTEEWAQQRLGKVTGSRAFLTMEYLKSGDESSARRSYREELVTERLTNLPAYPDGYVNYDMKWGIANEATAKVDYQLRTGRTIEPAPFVQHPKLMAGASPDGFVGKDGLIEIKCPKSINHLYKVIRTQEVPKEYMAQMMTQMWVTGRKWCDFMSYDSRLPKGLQYFVHRVHRDDKLLAELEAAVVKFLAEVDAELAEFNKFIEK